MSTRDEKSKYLESIELQSTLVGLVKSILLKDKRPTTKLEAISFCKKYFDELKLVDNIHDLKKPKDKSHAQTLLDHVIDQHKDQTTHQKLVQALVSSVNGVQWVQAAALYYYDKNLKVDKNNNKDFHDKIVADSAMKHELPSSEECQRLFSQLCEERRFEIKNVKNKGLPITLQQQDGTFKEYRQYFQDKDTIRFERIIDVAKVDYENQQWHEKLMCEKEGLIFENCPDSHLITCMYYKGSLVGNDVLSFSDKVAEQLLRFGDDPTVEFSTGDKGFVSDETLAAQLSKSREKKHYKDGESSFVKDIVKQVFPDTEPAQTASSPEEQLEHLNKLSGGLISCAQFVFLDPSLKEHEKVIGEKHADKLPTIAQLKDYGLALNVSWEKFTKSIEVESGSLKALSSSGDHDTVVFKYKANLASGEDDVETSDETGGENQNQQEIMKKLQGFMSKPTPIVVIEKIAGGYMLVCSDHQDSGMFLSLTDEVARLLRP